jgi:hypothetical protein
MTKNPIPRDENHMAMGILVSLPNQFAMTSWNCRSCYIPIWILHKCRNGVSRRHSNEH